MTGSAWLVVGLGAALGAWLRWGLGVILNSRFPTLPLGTLVANLLGGYGIGWAMGLFSLVPDLPVEFQLGGVTGFLGGLTTFSTFSAEVMTLIMRSQYIWAMIAVTVHLGGSLAMTLLGWWSFGGWIG